MEPYLTILQDRELPLRIVGFVLGFAFVLDLYASPISSYVAQQCIFEDQDTSRHRINGHVGPISLGYAPAESYLTIL